MSKLTDMFPLHDIAKVERKLALFYVLRDIGLKSADEACDVAFNTYAKMLEACIRQTE